MNLREGGGSCFAFPKAELEARLGCKQFLKVIAAGRCGKGILGQEMGKDSKRGPPELGPRGPLGHLKDVLRPDHGWGDREDGTLTSDSCSSVRVVSLDCLCQGNICLNLNWEPGSGWA